MGYALKVEATLETETCGGCGTLFAIPVDMMRRHDEDGALIRCPNPSCPWPSMRRTESEVQKLQKQLAAEKERTGRANTARQWAEQAREQEELRHRATKGQLTKAKKRIAGGVCPCCKRSFENLGRHMKTKHPKYATEEG